MHGGWHSKTAHSSQPLQAAAAEPARKHGVFRTAKVLSLEYGKLKRLTTESHPGRRRTARMSASPARFPKNSDIAAYRDECALTEIAEVQDWLGHASFDDSAQGPVL
jgi:hypothetical protein